MELTPPTSQGNPVDPLPTKHRSRAVVVGAASLVAGILALGGVATAMDDTPLTVASSDQVEQPEMLSVSSAAEVAGDEDGAYQLSEADAAVFETFDNCLAENGLELTEVEAVDGSVAGDTPGPSATEAVAAFAADEMATIDAAFEACDSILGDLSDDVIIFDGDVDMGDDMIIFDGDVDMGDDMMILDGDVEWGEAINIDALDPAELEELGIDLDDVEIINVEELEGFEDFDGAEAIMVELSAEEEALFEDFDSCLADNGVNVEVLDGSTDATPATDAAIDAAFETCEHILEDLDVLFEGQVEIAEVPAN